MPPTVTHRLADVLLGADGPLEAFVRQRRDQDPPRPWRLIARDLYETAAIDITHESLRSWFPDETDEAVAG